MSAPLIRLARPEDATAYGPICSAAYQGINLQHGFAPDFPGPEPAIELLSHIFSSPDYYCVVAELDGRVIANVCLDERAAIAAVGPVTVDPAVQSQGLGRQLLLNVLEHARQRNFAGVRLVQTTFNNRSFALYSSVGFVVREPLACMQGRTAIRGLDGFTVRPARPGDLEPCNELCRRIHGLDRGRELAGGIARGVARVVERSGRLTGYASSLAMFGHAVGETNLELKALLASVDGFDGPGIMLPTRNAELLHWCLAQGLRVVQPMTLMSLGAYNEPQGAWLPSVVY